MGLRWFEVDDQGFGYVFYDYPAHKLFMKRVLGTLVGAEGIEEEEEKDRTIATGN